MKALSLQTRLVIATVFLGLYSLGASLSYWIRSEAEADTAHSFQRDLAVLSKLPRLQGRLRELDLLTDQYLLTGGDLWLQERQEALAQIRIASEDLFRLMEGQARERKILDDMDRQLKSYLVQQNQWIERRKSGRMSAVDAARIASRQRPFDKLFDLLIGMRDVNISDLQSRRLASRRASTYTFFVILLTGLAASAFLVFFLLRYVIWPVTELERKARAWELGRAWEAGHPLASPEIQSLYRCIKDLSERLNKQYEKEAELAKLKSQLVAVMSHEFNNALSVIHGVSALLQETEGKAPPEKREQYYRMLKANIRSLSMEANTILHMGRLESGNFALSLKRTDVGAVLRESVERLRIIFERKNHQVAIEEPEAPIPVKADAEALSLVITNLLSNAIKYTPEGGRIVLSLAPEREDPGLVRVGVADTGIGIPAQEQERVFSGYYRTKESKSAAKGFGVGLPLAAKIVAGHGSRLELDSSPGKGSDFHFILPAWREEV